ncbi:MAG TPA: hypothetical protein VIG66_03325 [Noviherbaspirillum sp.]
MGFLDGMRGKQPRRPLYRTIDGGHPAPFPDMTDEQLYNYEVTFNVAKRTFTHPPRPYVRPPHAPAWSPEPALAETMSGAPRVTAAAVDAREPVWAAHGAYDDYGVQPTPQPVRVPPPAQPPYGAQERQAEAPVRPRMRRNTAFDAPRYTARKSASPAPQPDAMPAVAGDAPRLDFSKPVRTITTKQPVDIITTRARHPIYKVHGYIGDDDVVSVFTLDGRLCENGPHFLENAPEQRQLHLNIYAEAEGAQRYRITQHDTREQADAAAEAGRVACVEVKLDL